MKKSIIVLMFPLMVAGCMTQPAVFPDPPLAGQAVAGAAVLGLADVQDDRPDNSAGKISALKISAGADMLAYLEGALKSGLVDLGYQVVNAPSPSDVSASNGQSLFSGKTVLPIVKRADISSADAMLDPADASFDIVLKVYSTTAEAVYSNSYHGAYSERLGMVASGKKPGKVLAKAADAAVDEALKDPEFAKALS